MNKTDPRTNVSPFSAPGGDRSLPYVVELWTMARTGPERVIGRAASLGVATAIFQAALAEHLGRRIVLRRGDDVLQTSG